MPHSTAVPASVIAHLCACPDPFAYVGPILEAATLFETLGLKES
jgi:hypothetical protein